MDEEEMCDWTTSILKAQVRRRKRLKRRRKRKSMLGTLLILHAQAHRSLRNSRFRLVV